MKSDDIKRVDVKVTRDNATDNEGEFVFLAIQLFNESPDAIIVIDESGVIKYSNDQAELLFGYHRSELDGQQIELLVPDASREKHVSYRARYMDDPRRRPMGAGLDLKAKKKNGNEIPVEINLSPVSTPYGLRVIATIRRKSVG